MQQMRGGFLSPGLWGCLLLSSSGHHNFAASMFWTHRGKVFESGQCISIHLVDLGSAVLSGIWDIWSRTWWMNYAAVMNSKALGGFTSLHVFIVSRSEVRMLTCSGSSEVLSQHSIPAWWRDNSTLASLLPRAPVGLLTGSHPHSLTGP